MHQREHPQLFDDRLHGDDPSATSASTATRRPPPPRPSPQHSDRSSLASIPLFTGGALSAAVLPTLEAAQIYEPVDDGDGNGGSRRLTRDGEILPITSRKKQFPRALRRLRDRLQTLEDRLKLDVNALRQQIADLHTQSALLETKRQVHSSNRSDAATRVVVEYFAAFRDGWKPPSPASAVPPDPVVDGFKPIRKRSQSPPYDNGMHDQPQQQNVGLAERQRHWITSSLHPSMQLGRYVNGTEVLVDQWRRYSDCHREIRLSLSALSCNGDPTEPLVIAVGTLSGYITHRTVQVVFPHILADAQLVHRLVGSYIQYPVRKVFHFGVCGRIVRVDTSVDFVTALQSVLGSLSDVDDVLAGAFIEESCLLGVLGAR